MGKPERRLVISNRLHVFRAEKRISQEELAKIIGVTRGTIIAIEGGDYNPSLDLAFRLARHFRVGIEEIFNVEGEVDEKA
jgi:putative transcriptional regulator